MEFIFMFILGFICAIALVESIITDGYVSKIWLFNFLLILFGLSLLIIIK